MKLDVHFGAFVLECVFPLITDAAHWARAQGQTIAQQLAAGIRYLDLRVEPKGDTPWIVHTFWSVPVSDVLTQVNDFITQNPKEVVLLDFNHFYDMTPAVDPSASRIDHFYVWLKARAE